MTVATPDGKKLPALTVTRNGETVTLATFKGEAEANTFKDMIGGLSIPLARTETVIDAYFAARGA